MRTIIQKKGKWRGLDIYPEVMVTMWHKPDMIQWPLQLSNYQTGKNTLTTASLVVMWRVSS